MQNENFLQNQKYKGIIKNNNVQDFKIGSCRDVLEWMWNKKNSGNEFLLIYPNSAEKQVHPQHFSQKDAFIDTYSNIPCLNNTIHKMVMDNKTSTS